MPFLHVDLCQDHLVIRFRTQRETFSTVLLSLAAKVHEQDANLGPQEYKNYKQTSQSYYNKKICFSYNKLHQNVSGSFVIPFMDTD